VNFNIEYEQEEDGRWLAEVIGLPGVLAYGNTPDEAMIKAEALALRAKHVQSRPFAAYRVTFPPWAW